MTLLFRLCITLWAAFSIAKPLSDFSQSLLIPPPPNVSAEAYIIIDANTGSVLAEKNSGKKLSPASLTKLMTSYVIFHALSQGHLHLDDEIHVSTNAWKTEGSRLFLNEHSQIPLETLLKGVIITSGNDATVALSEHFAGSEDSFAQIMNRYAQKLSISNSHFVTTTGLDDPNHYSTAEDIAKLSRYIINDFPEYFHWFHEKSITHNGITQNNRNHLLNTHPEIDGLKTGHTNKAGYCLSTTAQRNNTRLVVVTLNSPSTKQRDIDTLALLNYGFRFYETILLYPNNTTITNASVYKGIIGNIDAENHKAFWATIPKGAHNNLKVDINIFEPLQAPLSTDDIIGTVSAYIDDEEVAQQNLYPSNDIQESSGVANAVGSVQLLIKKWL